MIANIAYSGRSIARPRYHANDTSRDVLEVAPQPMPLIDGRLAEPELDSEGFILVQHQSHVDDLTNPALLQRDHVPEIAALVQKASGADHVVLTSPGLLRYSERSGKAGAFDNSRPARFAHVDVSDATARVFARQSLPEGKAMKRFAMFNVWRVLSQPPQDVPLTLCDARSVAAEDMIAADAVFDAPDRPEWLFESWVVAHNPLHRWHWFADMSPNEALIFKTHDSLPGVAHCVPHVAFDNPDCPDDAPPRVSLEMRATAYWFE